MNLKQIIEAEGNEESWIDPESKLKCKIIRNGQLAWCGYVQVNEGHAASESHYVEIRFLIAVHGSLTFSGELKNEEGYWFGFDCGHSQDIIPILIIGHGFEPFEGTVYRDKEYAKHQCTRLAWQLSLLKRVNAQLELVK